MRTYRTHILVLELLAAVCLVPKGHARILQAFDTFQKVSRRERREDEMEPVCVCVCLRVCMCEEIKKQSDRDRPGRGKERKREKELARCHGAAFAGPLYLFACRSLTRFLPVGSPLLSPPLFSLSLSSPSPLLLGQQ